MFKKSRLMVWLVALMTLAMPVIVFAQEVVAADGSALEDTAPAGGMGLWAVIAGSGWLGIVLWLALLGCSIAAAWLAIDFSITVNPKKIIPDSLVNDVREAMEAAGLSATTIDRVRRALGFVRTGAGCAAVWHLPNDTTNSCAQGSA